MAAFCSPLFAEEEATKGEATPTVAITQDGSLKGKVFSGAEGAPVPQNAKVTLSSEGVVIDTVEAEEDGSFAFAGIGPGSFQIIGAADGLIGGQAINVQPYAGELSGGCSSCAVALEPAYQEAPCSTCSDSLYQAPASACGCGGGGFGGGGFGGGGGGILGGRRLLALGGVGAIIAIATSDDDDDDVVSPTE